MGSVFLSDDYRLPDVTGSAPLKKEGNAYNNSSIQGIFENNPCFASIKKELGFLDGSRTCGDDDIYAETRARSSPVVERLILQEIQSDIAEYAASIGISIDPEQWNINDTRKWLHWVANIYQLGDLGDCLSFDGTTLCNFSEQEFILLTGSEDTGLKIAAQLDLWKNAIRMTPSAGFYHFQQQQAMDCKFGTPQARSDAGTPKLLAASCAWSASPSPQAPSQTNYPPNHMTNNTGSMLPDYHNYHSPYQQYPQNPSTAPACFPHEEVRYPPRPTIPLDRFGNYRAACQSDNFCPVESYQRYIDVGHPTNPFQKGAYPTMHNKEARSPANNLDNKAFEESLRDLPKEYINTLIGQKTYTVDAKESLKALAILSKPDSDTPKFPSTAASTSTQNPKIEEKPVKLEKVEPVCSVEKSETAVTSTGEPNAKPARKKSSKHPIHLWEFLRQLLHEGKDCIRWLDQEKGIFKIYNSQQVAKLWGERKNRPAMNYDKLSRSVRQYYKKGIIKKTSQSKRLVYQFCEPYL